MRKIALVSVAAALLFSSAACYGPMQLYRQFDDWSNQTYVDSPWLGQVLWITGISPACYIIAGTIDELILNPIQFWGQDAFRGKGTPFIHRNPEANTPR